LGLQEQLPFERSTVGQQCSESSSKPVRITGNALRGLLAARCVMILIGAIDLVQLSKAAI